MSKIETNAASELVDVIGFVVDTGRDPKLQKWYNGKASPEEIIDAQQKIKGLRVLAAKKYGADYRKMIRIRDGK